MQEYILNDAEETRAIGSAIAKQVKPGTTLVLSGDLGSGKTTLTQGIGMGLGIKQLVKSPTYTLIREYDDGIMPLYHMDVYRLEDGEIDLGLEEYFEGDGLVVVEWGEMIAEELPSAYYQLNLAYTEDNRRKLTITPVGADLELLEL